MGKPKVLCCIPTTGYPCYELTQWIVKMKEESMDPNCPFELKFLIGKAGHQNPTNNALLNAAFMDEGYQWEYYLKIDDDLVPDHDLIYRLVKLDKDIIGVGVAIWRESLNGVFIAASNLSPDGKMFVRAPIETERIGKCYYVGGGCIMIKRHVLEKMKYEVWQIKSDYIYGEHKPNIKQSFADNIYGKVNFSVKQVPVWSFEYDDYGRVGLGSDEIFCKKARDMGYEIWYDCTVVLEQHTDLLVGSSAVEGILSVDIHQNQDSAGKKRMVTKEDAIKGISHTTRWESPIEDPL